jgi:ABC-2 type transport system permease protein
MKVQSKGFIIGTIVAPLALALLMIIPGVVAYYTATTSVENMKVLISDNTGLIADNIISIDTKQYSKTTKSENELKDEILKGNISAALILTEQSIIDGKARILTGEGTGLKFIEDLRNYVNNEVKNIRMKNAGIDKETIDIVTSSVNFETIKVTEKGAVQDDSEIMSVVSYALGFIMYALMFMYGSQVMQGVHEEKINRIVEVLASSTSPFQIMFGKVVGIGAVGLTQILLWVILGSGVMLAMGAFVSPDTLMNSMPSAPMSDTDELFSMINGMGTPDISPWYIVAFIFYFLTGYFIFSTLFAAAASTVDTMQDTNNLVVPLSILIIIPILLIPNITMNPEGTFAVIMSLFPFFTPITMVSRIVTISVPIWQIILSIFLQVATFILCIKFAAKIYRIGMLRYGKKATFKDILIWIKEK